MHALTALLIVNRRQGNECARRHAGLFDRFAASGRLVVFAFVKKPLRNSPRSAAVVVPGRMNQQNFKLAVVPPIKQRPRGFLHECKRSQPWKMPVPATTPSF